MSSDDGSKPPGRPSTVPSTLAGVVPPGASQPGPGSGQIPSTQPYPQPNVTPAAPHAAPPGAVMPAAPQSHYSGPTMGAPQVMPSNASGPTMSGPPRQPDPADSIEEVPGSQFVSFLKISSKRAFRLRIEPREVLPAERRSLERASPPITDMNLQAFLAWRRSVLFLVAVALVPLTIIGLIDAMALKMPTALRVVKLAPAITEALFCWICWNQLKRWAHWRTQRRKLFWGWVLFMATPFVVFLYPLSTVVREAAGDVRGTLGMLGALGPAGMKRATAQAVMPFVFAMIAMLQLAPKAISLMPGLIRSSLVIKLLFPGSTAPGWMIVLVTPLYALLAYVILIVPYQFTGSGYFIAGVIGIVIGQAVLARAGFKLATPLTEEEALRHIRRVRLYYMFVMLVSAVLIVVALGSLVDAKMLRWTDVATAVLKFETNVLILTMIGADLVVTNLDRARAQTAGRAHVEEQTEVKIAAFVSLDAPPPPPPGPAQ